MHMGEELEDIPVEVYKPRRARHFEDEKGLQRRTADARDGRDDIRGGRDDRRRGDSDREEHRYKGSKAEKDSHHDKGDKSGKEERRKKEAHRT